MYRTEDPSRTEVFLELSADLEFKSAHHDAARIPSLAAHFDLCNTIF